MPLDLQTDPAQNGAGYLRRSKIYKAIIAQAPPITGIAEGPLEVGAVYRPDNVGAGDDFSNVGGPTAQQLEDFEFGAFAATGTTPSVWSNGTTLKLIQAPVAVVLENNLGGAVTFLPDLEVEARNTIVSDGLFTVGKTIIKPGTGGSELAEEITNPNMIKLKPGWVDTFGSWIEIEVYP